jgi:hypothetical protein
MNMLRTTFALSLTVPGLLLACNTSSQGNPLPGTPELQASSTGPTQKLADKAVVDRLAAARCDQEEGCKNVGPAAKYASRGVCMDQIRGSIGNSLNAYACPKGLDADAVDRCMAAIKSEECSHPFDTLARFDRCRTDSVCMR